jgi:hypothetical protein
MDPAGCHLDREQHIQPAQQDRVHGEEVDGQHAAGLCAEELPPGDRRPPWCGIDAGALQDGPHRAGPDPALVAEAAQLAVDAAIPPGGVLPSKPQHQRADLRRDARTATAVRVGPAASDQVAMPAQQRRRLHEHTPPSRTRQQPGEPGQHRPIGPIEPRPVTWRRSTATSWRSMSSSTSLVAVLLASSTSHRSTWQNSRYSSRRVMR